MTIPTRRISTLLTRLENPQSRSGLAGAAYGRWPTRTRTRPAMMGAAFRLRAAGRVTSTNLSSARVEPSQ